MSTSYKHLMVISDGETLENSLHLTDRDRAVRLFELIVGDEIGDGELSTEVESFMEEADQEAAQADYPEGVTPPSQLDPEDYIDALKDFLSARGIDLHLDKLVAPETNPAEAVGAK